MLTIVFVIAACNKDERVINIDDFNTTTPENKPFEVNFNTFPKGDNESIRLMTRNLEEIYFSRSVFIRGNCTHIKAFNSKQSYYNIIRYEYDARLDKITQYINGAIANNNGDTFFFSGYLIISLTDNKIVGKININYGFGKFLGIFGSIIINGTTHIKSGANKITGKGFISYYNN